MCGHQPHPRRFGADSPISGSGRVPVLRDRDSAVPVMTKDCLARDRLSSLLENAGATSRQGSPSGSHGSPIDRSPSGFRPRGSNAAPFGARGSGAQTTSPPGVDVRGERALRHVRARAPKDAELKLEPPVPLFGASTGSRTSLFGDASRSRRQPCAFGHRTDAVDSPSG
jgi:hypothetical protein